MSDVSAPMPTQQVRPSPVDPKWMQLAGMHAALLERVGHLADVLEVDARRKVALDGLGTLAQLEEEYTPQNTTGTTASVQPKTANYFLVEQITWSIPAAATGTIQLGDRFIPIGAGANSIRASMLLAPNDVRSITSSGAGALFLHLAGRIISPQTWLH